MKDLEDMTQRELRETVARATVLLDEGADPNERLVFQALEESLKAQGSRCPTYHQAQRQRDWAIFTKAAPTVVDFAKDGFRATKPHEIRHALDIIVGAATSYAKQVLRPALSFGLVVRQLTNAPRCVDWQFPDYGANGLLPTLLTKELPKCDSQQLSPLSASSRPASNPSGSIPRSTPKSRKPLADRWPASRRSTR